MAKSTIQPTTRQPYPQLSHYHTTTLHELACVRIIRTPDKVLHGGAVMFFYPPTLAQAKRMSLSRNRPYLGYLQPTGEVIVGTIDGLEVARGALGYAWESSAFDAHRQAVTTKGGKQ